MVELIAWEKGLVLRLILVDGSWSILNNNFWFWGGVHKNPCFMKWHIGLLLSLWEVILHERLSVKRLTLFWSFKLEWAIFLKGLCLGDISFQGFEVFIETHELSNEANVGINLLPFPPNMIQCFLFCHTLLIHEVASSDNNRSWVALLYE